VKPDTPLHPQRLQRGSGIFKPVLTCTPKEMQFGDIPRSSGVLSGVAICPVSELVTQYVETSETRETTYVETSQTTYPPDFE
jgi:hypothetical protein